MGEVEVPRSCSRLYANPDEDPVEFELSFSVEARAVVGDESTTASGVLLRGSHVGVVERSVCIKKSGPVAE